MEGVKKKEGHGDVEKIKNIYDDINWIMLMINGAGLSQDFPQTTSQ